MFMVRTERQVWASFLFDCEMNHREEEATHVQGVSVASLQTPSYHPAEWQLPLLFPLPLPVGVRLQGSCPTPASSTWAGERQMPRSTHSSPHDCQE